MKLDTLIMHLQFLKTRGVPGNTPVGCSHDDVAMTISLVEANGKKGEKAVIIFHCSKTEEEHDKLIKYGQSHTDAEVYDENDFYEVKK